MMFFTTETTERSRKEKKQHGTSSIINKSIPPCTLRISLKGGPQFKLPKAACHFG